MLWEVLHPEVGVESGTVVDFSVGRNSTYVVSDDQRVDL